MGSHPRVWAWAAVLALFFAGLPRGWCGETGERGRKSAARTLRVTGSSTMCPMIAEIAKRFETLQTDTRVDVQCGGSDRGIKDVREGSADIGMVTRVLKTDEKGLFNFPMARDGVSVIVHKTNPVEKLSSTQLAGIFSGKITTWREVGGQDLPIRVILREPQKPVTELFAAYFSLQGALRGEVVPGDNPVTLDAVAADPHAIGYVSSGEAERHANAGQAIRLIPVGGVLPTARNVITANYPLTRPLTLISRDLPAGLSKQFVDYCLSPKVVDLIVRFGFVPYED